MRTTKSNIRCGVILAFVLVLVLCGFAFSYEVSWISGESGPPEWSITPTSPTTSDVIRFSGPTETFSNSCVAEGNMGGTATLSIDQVNKTIELWFKGPPPTVCPFIWDPVCGLEGSFGPLEAGQWRFFCQHSDASFSISFTVGAVGTGFTYQGRLIEDNTVADGLYDLDFKLFDDLESGTQQGSTNMLEDTDVIDGYFTVVLDFGSDVFNGDPRWLEIGVRLGDSTDGFTTLSPRQEIMPTPYALFARNGGGAGDRHSLDAADGDPVDVVYVDNEGNVGIGITSPEAKLEVYGSSQFSAIIGNNTSESGYGLYGSGSWGIYGVSASTYGRGVYGEAAGNHGRGVEGLASSMGDVTNYGGQFDARGATGVGVLGVASYPGNARNYGGRFEAEGSSGRGVMGSARGSDGQGVVAYGKAFDFYAEGPGIDYGTASSVRWKSDIQPIDDPLGKVMDLRGVYFNWDAEHGGQHDVGMIAEEVGEVLPEIVSYEENGIDATGMDYSKLTPLLVEAIKALKNEADERQKKLAEKDVEIVELRARLEALEARIGKLTVSKEGTEI